MADRTALPRGADSRPRIYLSQVLRNGRTYGAWHRGALGSDKLELTVPLALEAALTSIGHAPAVIMWMGREGIDL